MRTIARYFAMMLSALLAAGGCAPESNPEVCRSDCRLKIFLPEDPEIPPRIPALLHVAGGQMLNIDVHGRRPSQARTLVILEQPAFENEAGTPVYSLDLITGHNHHHLRDYQAGVCRAPEGCRFFVVNAGLAIRPPAISGAGILIIEPPQ